MGEKPIQEYAADSHSFDEAGRKLRKWLYPDGKALDPARASKLREWLQKHDIRELSLTFLLRASRFEAIRIRLVTSLTQDNDE